MTTVGPVSLDGFAAVLGQYDPQDRWNGWLSPSLDAHSVVTVLDAINAHSADGPVYAYAFEQGVLFLDDLHDPDALAEWIEPDEDGLYPLGSHAWVWSADEMPPPRHLFAVPDLPTIVCMYANTGNGPCGGHATQKGDGYDYCQNHGELRLLR